MCEHQQSEPTGVSRRELLKKAGVVAGAITVGRYFLGGYQASAATGANPATLGSDVLQVAHVKVRTAAQRAALIAFDDTHSRPRGAVELLLWPGDQAHLDELGFDYEIVIPDLLAHERRENGKGTKPPRALLQTMPGGARDTYRTLANYNDEMAALATNHPGLARRIELPERSLEGRSVYGIEIGTNLGVNDGRPVFYVDGVHHAREWPAGEYPMFFAHYLLENYATDATIKRILDTAQVTIIPIVNVDGFNYSRSFPIDVSNMGIVAGGQGQYWRKNRRGNPATDQVNSNNPAAYGVDPNRNYAFLWGATTDGIPTNETPVYASTSPNPTDQTYYGLDAFSEPEVRNVANYIKSHNVVGVISNHTSGRLVLRPWGHTSEPSIDEGLLKAIGDRIALLMKRPSDTTGYESKIGLGLYPTTGTTDDWAYAALTCLGYTIEHSTAFHPNYTTHAHAVAKMWPFVMSAFLHFADEATKPANHSVVKGSVADDTGAPVKATLTIYKEFATPTWEQGVDGVGPTLLQKESTPEVVDMASETRADGTFEWHLNPSTRPLEAIAGVKENWTLTVTAGGKQRSVDVYVERGQVKDLGVLVLS